MLDERNAVAAPALPSCAPQIPDYLPRIYWWAYVHPRAVRLFERQWLANLILWGNYRRLTRTALEMLGASLPGRTLQIACVYGSLTGEVATRAAAAAGKLDVVDVLPLQLQNLKKKLDPTLPVKLMRMDSSALAIENDCYDRALIFFLLHEQPVETRTATLGEAFRVVRPGGRVVIVEYARPKWWHPLRYLFRPVLRILEPYALDLWKTELAQRLRTDPRVAGVETQRHFGGLYQSLSILIRAAEAPGVAQPSALAAADR